MPSPKRQTSQGYLSGVLAGGARPFRYRGRMRSILPAATTEGGALVKSIAKVPPATFHYPLTADFHGPLGAPPPGPLPESVTGHPVGDRAPRISGETSGRDPDRSEIGRAGGDMAPGPIPRGAEHPSVLSGRPHATGDREARQDVRPIAEAILKVAENDDRLDVQPGDEMILPEPRRPSVAAPRLIPDSSADPEPLPAPVEPMAATEIGGKARPTPIDRAQLEVPGVTGHLPPAHRGFPAVTAAPGVQASPLALVQGDSDKPVSKGQAAPEPGRQATPRPDLSAAVSRPELGKIEPQRNPVVRRAATSVVPQRAEPDLAPMPTSDMVQRLRTAAADFVAKTSRQPSSAATSQAGAGPQGQAPETPAANGRDGAPNRETVIRQVVVAPSPAQHGAPSAFWERSYLGRFRLRGFR